MAKETFGQRISKLRKEKGFTQSELADKVGVSAQAVSKWENDQATPDIDMLLTLAVLFEVTLDELLGKEKPVSTMLVDKPTKKDIDKMVLRICCTDSDGSNVNINLPLALVRIFVNKDDGKIALVSGNKDLEGIDFRKLIELVEQGVVGEIMTADSADGGHVRIVVE